METNTTIDPSSIERTVCEAIGNLPTQPMDQDMSSLMIQLMISGVRKMTDDEKPFLYQLIEKRVKACFSYTIEDKLILFLCFIAKSPGAAVMYLWYLQMVSRDRGIKHMTLSELCNIFPIGFPSDKALHSVWNSQKVSWRGSDNMVDHAEAGKSLFELK